ncbi:phosphotransferase [Psychrobacillus sp.]|uniref:phosphotransferase n=1 Tax=Psychrobacillus sp. TaxID=1871623 RepID=UPI0028BD3F25|nr:phosphotransferase [Psychrobacillus sp.]
MSYYIRQIKKNVWKWENENGLFSVKKYPTIEQAEKIRSIHQELLYLKVPFILPVIETAQSDFIVQPWFKGTHSVDYANEEDRKHVHELLKGLHETIQYVDWKENRLLPHFDLIGKWKNRFEKMKDISYFLAFYLEKEQIAMLLEYGEYALSQMKPFSRDEMTLLHGDVVHHNFLSNEVAYKMIDFDLAVLGPKEVEEILWIHRVLPTIDYNISFLLEEFPALEEVVLKHREALIYPNELYREWLYAFALPQERKLKFIEQLVPYTNKALTEWPNLCYNLSHM